MSTYETQRDFLRIEPNFRKSLVKEVLPEYFQESYPNLIEFLDGYYEWLDSDENVGGAIQELRTVRDLQDTTLQRLDLVFNELALGISQTQFLFPIIERFELDMDLVNVKNTQAVLKIITNQIEGLTDIIKNIK